MNDLSQFEAQVENARLDLVRANALGDPRTDELFRSYWELLRDYNYASTTDAQVRPYASRAGEGARTPEGVDVLVQVIDNEYNEEGLLPKWFANRARETWGDVEITEDQVWQLLATDNWSSARWVSPRSPAEALSLINALLVGPEILQDHAAPQTAGISSPSSAPSAPATGTVRSRSRGTSRPPAKDRTELMKKLTEGVAALANSDEWKRHLEVQARFHHYSAQNVDLIMLQKPTATQVAGFDTWRRLGRFPNKGTGIVILAPLIYKKEDEETGERTASIRGFKFVNVFDASDTYGAPLPEVAKKLEGQDSGHLYEVLSAFAPTIGFSVMDHEFPEGGPNGDCNHDNKTLRVSSHNSGAQRVKTLAHELAHAILHGERIDRGLGELEAESTAFVVCKALGIDSEDYSFGYVAGWADGTDEAVANIKLSSARIQQTAERLLNHCERLIELSIDQGLVQELRAGDSDHPGSRPAALAPSTDGPNATDTTAIAHEEELPARPGIADLEAAVEAARLEVQMRQVEGEISTMTHDSLIRDAIDDVAALEDDLARDRQRVAAMRDSVVFSGDELRRFEGEVSAEVARCERILADRDGGDPNDFAFRRLGQTIIDLRQAVRDARPVSDQKERLEHQLAATEADYQLLTVGSADPGALEAVYARVRENNTVDPAWVEAQKAALAAITRPRASTINPGRGISR